VVKELFLHWALWPVTMIDKVLMRCSERYKILRFYSDYNRWRIPHDQVWNAQLMDLLMAEYGYGHLGGWRTDD